MNDLYIHQLETENKQLREALKTTRKVLEEHIKEWEYVDSDEYIYGSVEEDKNILDKIQELKEKYK